MTCDLIEIKLLSFNLLNSSNHRLKNYVFNEFPKTPRGTATHFLVRGHCAFWGGIC